MFYAYLLLTYHQDRWSLKPTGAKIDTEYWPWKILMEIAHLFLNFRE